MNAEQLTEIEAALSALRGGGIVFFPTETGWCYGCDGTNEAAVLRLLSFGKMPSSTPAIILLTDERDVLHYVAAPDLAVFDYLETQTLPTTVVFENGVNLPDALLSQDGSVAIRLVGDEFCRHVVKRLQGAIATVPAVAETNLELAEKDRVVDGVYYIVRWPGLQTQASFPHQTIRWTDDGTAVVLHRQEG